MTMTKLCHGFLIAAHWEEPVATASTPHLHMDTVSFGLDITALIVHEPDFTRVALDDCIESGQGVNTYQCWQVGVSDNRRPIMREMVLAISSL